MTQSDQAFKEHDSSSYDSVTSAFEKYTDRFSPPVARQVVELAGISPSDRVLDIGTGTGVVALEVARRLGEGGTVVGVDLSEGMLAVARAKAAAAGLLERCTFVRGDAEALDAPDQSFDAVVSLFALLHLPNPELALREFLRVLRPGGRLVVAVGSGPRWTSLEGMLHAPRRCVQLCKERAGLRLSALAFMNEMLARHLPGAEAHEESHLAREHHNRSGVVPELFRSAGFVDVDSSWQGYEGRLDDCEEFWELQATFSSVARKRLADSPQEKVRAFKDRFIERCERVRARGGTLAYPYAGLFVVGMRPRTGPAS